MTSYFFFEYAFFFYELISNGWLMDNSLSFGEGWVRLLSSFSGAGLALFGE